MSKISIRPAKRQEQDYCYSTYDQINGQTGFIGYLSGYFGTSGEEFYTTWCDGDSSFRGEDFSPLFDEVVNSLQESVLKSFSTMKKYCYDNRDAKILATNNYNYTRYAYRIDYGKYSFIMRLNPQKGDYNFYIFCYIKEYFDDHLKKAANGIRFVNSGYKFLFKIPDRGRILIHDCYNHTTDEYKVSYIDDTHFFVGNRFWRKDEFAEVVEEWQKEISPVLPKCGISFIDDCIQGFSTVSNLDDYIDYTHKHYCLTLCSFLGITEAEHKYWVDTSEDDYDVFMKFIKARKQEVC